MVSTTAFHATVRGSFPSLGGLKKNKNVSSPSTRKTQYCGEPPWPTGSVLGYRPPGFEFRILYLEGKVISPTSPSSGGSPGPIYPVCALSGLKLNSFHFHVESRRSRVSSPARYDIQHSKQYRFFRSNPSVLSPCNPRRALQGFSLGFMVIVLKGYFYITYIV